MKKKKYPEDLMEEDLMETIQHRINELTAELKLLNARPGHIAREPIPGAGNATTPRKFFHGGYLLPRVSTFVDSMHSISQIDPYYRDTMKL